METCRAGSSLECTNVYTCILISALASYRRVCYYTNWAQYRNGQGKFYPENVDPNLCTHVIYAFAKLNGNHLKAFEWNDESTPWMKGMYERFNKIKQQNPSLKTMLAVGGWNMGSAPFTQMVATDASRRDFATDAVKFLRKQGFDGLDIDWEYPANRGSPAGDKQKFVELIKVIRAEFDKEAQTTGNSRLLLSAATPAGKSNIDTGYDVPSLPKYLDMMNLMTYDFHGGSFEDKTGHNSPLYVSPKDTGNNTMLNVEWAANYWVSKGMPKSMMNIGMPLYGRSFTLASPSDNGLYAPDRGNGGQAGRYTRESGFLSYYEICDMLKTGGTRHFLPAAKVPYVVKGDQWVGYDDPESLRYKVDFVKSSGFGGVMVWALDLDDFSGMCGEGKYPLLQAINDELNKGGSMTTAVASTTVKPTVQTTQPSGQLTASPTASQNSGSSSGSGYRRVCYYTNWAQYRNGPGKFYPENVDPNLCTHVIYAFAKLNGNHLKAFEWNDESTPWMKGMYERFNKLKQQNPALKTMLAVGGWNMGSAPFTRMVATDASRRDFATDAVKFLRKQGFDGLDIDWEYPANRGSPAGDKQKYVELIKVIRAEFDKEAQTTGNSRLLLSAATPAGKSNIDTGYDVPSLPKYLDMMNLMTYDFHGGSFEDKTGHNSPLYVSPKDTGNNTMLNVEWAANYWVSKGMPKSMMNIGMPLYGRSFTLASPSNNGLYAPDRGNGGQAGRYTSESGFLSYYEICDMLKTGGTRHFLPAAKVPYVVKGDQWVGYDDPESLRYKVDFVKSSGFGGVMVWALDLDDFSGMCGEGKYPLLQAINDELNKAGPMTTAVVPTTVNPAVQTTQPSAGQLTASSTASQHSGSSSANGIRVVCYYTNWSQYRNRPGKFYPENVDPSLCTHVIYAFAKLNGNHLKAFEWNDESTPGTKGMYERFNNLKQQNPALKTMLAVGGWNMGSAPFTQMVATDASRRDFATDAVKFLRKQGFDGLDIDWEYPANRGSPASDKQKYIELIKVLRAEFEKEAQTTGNSRLLLSAATPAGKSNIDSGYDVPSMPKYIDMMNLMTYDLHGGSFEDKTGHNSPLYASPKDTGTNVNLNVEWSANYWASKGMPKSMINIGMPLYGRTFTLANPSNNGLYAPDRGNGGKAGKYTGEAGILSYYEICEMLKTGGTRHFLPAAKVPYLVKGDQWVGYDDPESLRYKVDFVKNNGFGGAMVWSLDLDDFTGGTCGQGKYPLLHAINDELNSSGTTTNQVVSTTAKSTVQTTMTPAQTMAPTVPKTSPQNPTQPTMAPTVPKTSPQHPTQPTMAPTVPKTSPQQSTQPTMAPTVPKTSPQHPTQPTMAPTVSKTSPQHHTQPTMAPTIPQTQQPVQTTKAPTMKTTSTQPTTQTSKATVVTTPKPTQSPAQTTHQHHSIGPSQKFNCQGKASGFYPDPMSCTSYYICAGSQGFEVTCASGLKFNSNTKFCDWPGNVQCTSSQQQSSTQVPALTQRTTTQMTSTTPPTTTRIPNMGGGANQFCNGKSDGHYKDPTNCSMFYQCVNGLGFHERCNPGTVFNPSIIGCDFPYHVPGCNGQQG